MILQLFSVVLAGVLCLNPHGDCDQTYFLPMDTEDEKWMKYNVIILLFDVYSAKTL